MRRPKPPPALDELRLRLDDAAVKRLLIPLDAPILRAEDLAVALQIGLGSIALPLLVEVDGDRCTAIIPADARLDMRKLATLVGGQQARLAGSGKPDRRGRPPEAPRLLSGLPTVIDVSLTKRAHLFSLTSDPMWAIRIGPAELRRATNAQVGDIVRGVAAAQL